MSGSMTPSQDELIAMEALRAIALQPLSPIPHSNTQQIDGAREGLRQPTSTPGTSRFRISHSYNHPSPSQPHALQSIQTPLPLYPEHALYTISPAQQSPVKSAAEEPVNREKTPPNSGQKRLPSASPEKAHQPPGKRRNPSIQPLKLVEETGNGKGSGNKGGKGRKKALKDTDTEKAAKAEQKKLEAEAKVSAELEATDPLYENLGSKHWSDADQATVYVFLLGPGNTRNFDYVKDRNGGKYIFSKVVQECKLSQTRSWEAVKSLFGRAFKTYTAIKALEDFTGGGGDGDFDMDNDEEAVAAYSRKLAAAKSSGVDIGTLSAALVHKWHEKGWYTLFHDRYSDSVRVDRHHDYHSAQNNLTENEDTDIEEVKAIKPASQTVSEPKHTPKKPSKVQQSSSANNIEGVSAMVNTMSGFFSARAGEINRKGYLKEMKRLENLLNSPHLNDEAREAINARLAQLVKSMDSVA
ncbi:Histone acetyltransferase [Paramarasmius palmivorus]|uniref:Histone acetyltransferase n=1 Tax=Paramarasmius palmivorus TaxID=297713 RepID=A0AAW0B818_9AGAR